MNCTDANEILERMLFEEVPIDDTLRQHLVTCSACSRVYRDMLKSREVLALLRRSEPVLNNSGELTDNIIAATSKRTPVTPAVPMLLVRLLAAASVVLCLFFGYEQAVIVKKISALEGRFTGIREEAPYSPPLRMVTTFEINRAGISLAEIERRLAKGKGPALLSFSLIHKRLTQRNIK